MDSRLHTCGASALVSVTADRMGTSLARGARLARVIVFTSFDDSLPRAGFDCGNEAVNRWFHEQAGQQERRDNARTTLGLATMDSAIASFYSLVTHRIELDDAAQSLIFTARRYPIPAMLIAQLAVDSRYQGTGVGALTLGHALMTLARASKSVGFEAVVVDAADDDAMQFYLKYGFQPLVAGTRRLVMSTRQLRSSVDNV